MTVRDYIIDFLEPGQLADVYRHYLSHRAFLLNTSDELPLNSQVRLRFNLPDGNGTTIPCRVVSKLSDDGYGLQLPDNQVTKWLLERAAEVADRVERVRQARPDSGAGDGEERGRRRAEAEGVEPPIKREITAEEILGENTAEVRAGKTQRIAQAAARTRPLAAPTKGLPPVPAVAAADGEPLASDDVPSDESPALPDAAALAESLVPTEASLVERVREMDRWVEQQQARSAPGATIQASPGPHPVGEGAVEAVAEELPAAQLSAHELKIRALSATQKKKLAISGGPEEREILMRDADPALQIWVLKNPTLTEQEVVLFSNLASLSQEALSFILQSRRWGTSVEVARNLALNPLTPPEAVPGLLTILGTEALRMLVDTPGIRPLVSRQARRMLMERTQG